MEIKEHIEFSKVQLNILRAKIGIIEQLAKNSLCIYTTGSFPPFLVFPNCKPPLLCVAPGFCAWVITNKAGIGH